MTMTNADRSRLSREGSQPHDQVRGAELVAALCLASDLGMGFPFEHGLQSTLAGLRLADRLGVDRETATATYYASLLSHAGCTTDAHVTASVFGDSLTEHFNPVMYGSGRDVFLGLVRALPDPARPLPVRILQVACGLPRMARAQQPHLSAMCEVAGMLAVRVGAPPAAAQMLAYLTDRWDGRGPLRRARGEEIPLPVRIVQVAADVVLQRQLGGRELAVRRARERARVAFDPEIVACFADAACEILGSEHGGSVWEEALAGEPQPHLMLDGAAIDRALAAIGSFADLITPCLAGHSGGVAALAVAAAEHHRFCAGPLNMRRAALVHDLGRVAIGPRTWGKPGRLNAEEWEQVRLHAYHTERVLSRSPFLAALGRVAGGHHERLDGSGYHRGAGAAELSPLARLLAAADVYHAMLEPRPHRPALAPERAAAELAQEARSGRLDGDAVTAVLAATGQPSPSLARPGGLTDRETEVLRLVARGLQTKQVARRLGISVKTADHHIQHAYRKLGVSSRAAATVAAMEQGLLEWGEVPMASSTTRA
jgi:HD-GYP domain-containing protein (c-di-GMP phosphodiesterase class II)